MKFASLTAGVGVVVVAVALAGCSQNHSAKTAEASEGSEGSEVKVTMDQVPSAARTALQREAGGQTISSVDKETRNGRTVYETDVMSGGQNWEIVVDENGKLISKKVDNEADEKNEKR